ncbi:unnamed protein product [Clonostachys rhizophaga]|uniref:Uncharacterized protein n=1 Tax=Clonostachys rhizophaga TaxID=160324 RepID=A0A9N9VRV7_9HYPO|nr:unnamed protein product [Clonostachys rhizophaga]
MLPATLLPLLLVPSARAWTVPAYMDLASPPRWTTDIGDQYLVKNGEFQKGFVNAEASCMHKPVPTNVTRSYFPITGGSIRFDFVNLTTVSTGDAFLIDMYFNDDPWGENPDFKSGSLKRMQWWRGFGNGMSCHVPVDMTERLTDPTNQTAIASLEGLNVTFALQIQDYRNNSGVFEQVDQCAYVTLTSNTTLIPNDTLSSRELTEEEMCGRVNLDKLGTTTTVAATPSATSKTESKAARQLPISLTALCGLSTILVYLTF